MLESTNHLEVSSGSVPRAWLLFPGVPSSYFFFFPECLPHCSAAPFTLKRFLHVAPRTPFLLDFLSLTDSTSSVSFAGSSHRPDLQKLACSGPSPRPSISLPTHSPFVMSCSPRALIITYLGMTSKLTAPPWTCPLISTCVYSVAT